jgi:hypothetical protein
MTTRNEAIEVAKKLKALAEKAIDHEKANAVQKLKSFCQKHDLNEDEYATDLIRASVNYKNQEERSLLSNVLCMVMETDNVRGTDKNNSFSFQCTPYQFGLIKNAYSYYRNLYREYCEAILIAMVTKNEIINTKKNEKPFQMEPMTDEERQKFESQFTQEPAPEPTPDDTAQKEPPTASLPPPPPPPSQESLNKRQERIAKFLFVMDPNKWTAPKPMAKLFLS